MTETAAQREDRRRRGAEAAATTFDFRDAVRETRRRRELRDASGNTRATRSGSSPKVIAAFRRAALEQYAKSHQRGFEELLELRRRQFGPAADAYLRGVDVPTFRIATSPPSSCEARWPPPGVLAGMTTSRRVVLVSWARPSRNSFHTCPRW